MVATDVLNSVIKKRSLISTLQGDCFGAYFKKRLFKASHRIKKILNNREYLRGFLLGFYNNPL